MFVRMFKISLLFALISGFLYSQDKPKISVPEKATSGTEKTILVTAYPHNEKQRAIAAKLQKSDFAVLEDKLSQKIVSVRSAAETPIDIAIVIQDNLDGRVNSELKILKKFIRDLPEGSRVMTAYLTNGGAIITQELTASRSQAADTLRIIRNRSFLPTFSPYEGIRDVVNHFNEKTFSRKMILVVSDGLDMSQGYYYASPYSSRTLDLAIRDAEKRSVAIFPIYAPSDDRRDYGRFAYNFGQGSLIRLADETGGESYINGIDLINFTPYLEEFRGIFQFQWLVTYRSTTLENGKRRLEVTTDFDIHLHHQTNY